MLIDKKTASIYLFYSSRLSLIIYLLVSLITYVLILIITLLSLFI